MDCKIKYSIRINDRWRICFEWEEGASRPENMEIADDQTIIDEEHLKLLSIGYLISAGVATLFSLLGLMYVLIGVIMGAAFKEGTRPQNQPRPPAIVGFSGS